MSSIKLTESTKINDLIEEFPFVIDTLIKLDPKLKRLKNPFLRKTVGRRATLTDVSQMCGTPLLQLLQVINSDIEKKTLKEVLIKFTVEDVSGWYSEQARR